MLCYVYVVFIQKGHLKNTLCGIMHFLIRTLTLSSVSQTHSVEWGAVLPAHVTARRAWGVPLQSAGLNYLSVLANLFVFFQLQHGRGAAPERTGAARRSRVVFDLSKFEFLFL